MSGREHLSEDVLLDAVYGIAGEDAEAHMAAEAGERGGRGRGSGRAAGGATPENLRADRTALAQALVVGAGIGGSMRAGGGHLHLSARSATETGGTF